MKRKALIVGSDGQDGTYLTSFLLSKDYEVSGLNKHNSNILDYSYVLNELSSFKPDEIYYLAAFHHSSESIPYSSDELYEKSFAINVQGLGHFLKSIEDKSQTSKIFYASSSHIFGGSEFLQNEETQKIPSSAYARTKINAMDLCSNYRKKKLFVSVGILYNHESPLRSPSFVSRKISQGVARIHLGLDAKLELGNLDAEIDWGYAGDYVEAMWKILQLDKPDEFVVATGKPHTVREFVETAFNYVKLDYRNFVITKNEITFKASERRAGDSTKLRILSGWEPRASFHDLVINMVKADIQKLGTK